MTADPGESVEAGLCIFRVEHDRVAASIAPMIHDHGRDLVRRVQHDQPYPI
jgi:hypothetical protein